MEEKELNEYEQIMFDIDMSLYNEYNDQLATMYDHLGEEVCMQDIKDVEEAELNRHNELLKQNLRRVIEEKDKEISKLTAESTEFESKVYELQDLEKEHQKINGELREEIKKWKEQFNIVDHECSRLEQKEIWLEKQIDLMTEQILKDNEYIYNEFDNMNIEKIKQYFENKVKEGKNDK